MCLLLLFDVALTKRLLVGMAAARSDGLAAHPQRDTGVSVERVHLRVLVDVGVTDVAARIRGGVADGIGRGQLQATEQAAGSGRARCHGRLVGPG